MNYAELKMKCEHLKKLNVKVKVLESIAEKTTKPLLEVPISSGENNNNVVDSLADLKSKRDNLVAFLREQEAILNNSYVGNGIVLHLFYGYTWRMVATELGGNNEDSIQKMCRRFHW